MALQSAKRRRAYDGLLLLACVLVASIAPYTLRHSVAHELPGIAPENQAWYQNAETNVEARKTFPSPWSKCCNHAEVIPMQDIIFPTSDHGWQWSDNGEVKTIPDIIIHWNESAPDNRPTLFVYLGTMTCFYPPQGGV